MDIAHTEKRGAAVVVFVSEDGRVLLHHRAYPVETWAFIGGGIEAGEQPQEAALREVREELGYVVPALSVVGAYTSSIGTIHAYQAPFPGFSAFTSSDEVDVEKDLYLKRPQETVSLPMWRTARAILADMFGEAASTP